MKPGERLALAIVLGLAILVCGSTGAAAYAWHRAGSVRIAIHESRPGGTDISLSLPAILVNTAIAVCPVPNDAELHARLAQLSPILREVASQLSAMPDAVFVDMKDAGGSVRVEKSGPELLIRVWSPTENVEVAVPIQSVRQLMRKLEA